MKKSLGLLASLGAAVLLAAGAVAYSDSLPGGLEGCIVNGQNVSSPIGPVSHAMTCTYTATHSGGYLAIGSHWTLKIKVGTTTTTYTSANAPKQGCTLWHTGSIVTASISNTDSAIIAGNPYPAATDGVRPSNNC